MSKPGVITSMADFTQQFGDGPRLSESDLFRGSVENNIPPRWRWLANHPRLLSIAFFLRPSWQPDIQTFRVVGPESTAESLQR